MKRIFLIQPAFFSFLGIYSRYFPYHLVSIGTYLKTAGHEVKIFEGDSYVADTSLDFSEQEIKYKNYLRELNIKKHPYWESLKNELAKFNPDYIGITFWTTFIASSIKTAELCRRHCPSAMILAGGPHVTLMPDDIKQLQTIDVGVVGEGEQTFLEIVNGNSLDEIEGIFYRSSGGIQDNSIRPFIINLDSLGIPDRSLLVNKKRYSTEDFGLIMTSRGCPYSCAYCATSIWKRSVRYRSIDSIIAEISHVKNEYGTIYFTIKDDSFTVKKDRVMEFCRKLKEKKLNIFWECNANLINIDKDLLIEMKKAGCIAIKIGIETGSNKIHKIINKKLTNGIIEKQWEIIRSVDIHVTCYFMMGVPGETENDIYQTIQFARKMAPDYISYSIYEIFPGTRLHKKGVKENTAKPTMSIDEYFNTEPHNYYFANGKRHLPGMSAAKFAALECKFRSSFRKYNRSPKCIIARIRSRLPLYKAKPYYLIADLKGFLAWV